MFFIFIILLFYKKSINLFPHILILKISVLKYNKLLYLNMIFKYEKMRKEKKKAVDIKPTAI